MIAAFILVGLVVALAAVSAFLVWDRQPRHDRLDAEARVAAYDATVVPKPRPGGAL